MHLNAPAPRILATGGYQMDNFGDLLLLLVTEHYLREAKVVAAGAFLASASTDMKPLLDRETDGYGPLLEKERFDAIWTVGGELCADLGQRGGDLQHAFWIAATEDAYREFEKATNDAERDAVLYRATGGSPIIHPDMPSPAEYPPNAGSVSVLNSAGIAHILDVPSAQRAAVISLLRGTTYISIRDRRSSELLDMLEIEHSLVPDAVHAISVTHPRERSSGSDYAIVQMSDTLLSRLGTMNVAQSLMRSRTLRGLPIRILVAGTIGRSPAFQSNAEVRKFVKDTSPNTDIEVIEERRPFDLVEQIAGARLTIGTSLHLRIVSAAYNVPRVSLADLNPKVNRYAGLWDHDMPYDASIGALDHAIDHALALADDPETVRHSTKLSTLAHENLEALAEKVLAPSPEPTEAEWKNRSAQRQAYRMQSS
ncbi:polysaccharide pyruvyl transferase family protein [Amycolatopsis jejuensis]|uniref:polysaccharide pyruvyl transferase family protein n=1 Tax=Amycolatopsis jejuensis TaxID=330084 RepID=UPI000525EEBE|nr:polysaccharide pyruvyl transferase family protein [Amycolatopsis jejuensis]